jgi:8-oxo-dGTP diphosphatase
LDPGELPTEGAIRETKEETGLDVEVERLFIIGVTQDQLLGFVFYCRIIGGRLTTSDESDAVNFFTMSELPAMIPPRKLGIIQAAYQNPSEILYRHVTLPPGRQWYAEQVKKDR